MDRAEFHPSEIPAKPGVYVYRDRFGEVIYVGKASNLRRRMSSYFQPSRLARADAKLRSLVHSIADFSYEIVRTEDEALILESRLIKDYAPYYNILMRDDKRYLLLKIDPREKFPTLKLARIKKNDGATYFGPFPQGGALKLTLEFLLTHFKLRACRDCEPDEETKKRCLKRIVHDCSAPCTGAVTEAEYRRQLDAAVEVLNGNLDPVSAAVEQQMRDAAAAKRFEKAALLRDVLTNLKSVFGARNRAFEHAELPGETPGMAAAEALGKRLGLAKTPRHVIGFDISNILGKLAVSSLVAATDGRPDRSRYRRFRIRTVGQSDDFAMMAETVTRHFSRLLEEHAELPDLVMVDGGKGQLSAAIKALAAIGCPPLPVIGLAEKNEEIYLPGRSLPLVLSRHDPALKLLQALRDEAHRFAITYHRNLRNKLIEQSVLDDFPGIGKMRKKALLTAFGSVRGIRQAAPEAIAEAAPGLGVDGAERLLGFLKIHSPAAKKRPPTEAPDREA